jgi:hypothetical protein
LFDILNEGPEFSPRVEMKVGHRLNITTASDEIWTLNLLQEVCNDVFSWDLPAKFRLFIDGLASTMASVKTSLKLSKTLLLVLA